MIMLKKSNDSLRLVLTIALCGLLLIGYGKYAEMKKKEFEAAHPESQKDGSAPSQKSETFAQNTPPYSVIGQDGGVSTTKSQAFLQKRPLKEEKYELKSNRLLVAFSTKGGVVVSNELLGYRQRHDFSLNSKSGYETGSLLFSKDIRDVPVKLDYVKTDQSENRIVFESRFENQRGALLSVVKTYTLEEYELSLDIKIQNIGKSPYVETLYVVNGSSDGLSKDYVKGPFDVTVLSYTYDDDNKDVLGFSFKDYFSGKKDYAEVALAAKWIALKSRFYFQSLGPKDVSYPSVFWTSSDINGDKYYIGAYKAALNLEPNEYHRSSFTYTFLPQSRELFNSLYNKEKKDFYLVQQQFSFMKVISDILYFCIEWVFGFTKNYGLTIIIVTILIKLLFYPLTQKSYKSMQKMQELSPKIQELRKKYADNPVRLNTEMMALYKKENVNMMAGCLPMLLPLPIFIALYMLFRNMFELDGVSFLWIKDLSAPDAIFSFKKALPFVGQSIQLMPFLLLGTQIIQNKFTTFNPATADNDAARTQMMMMKYMMPAMFFIISWGLPSALTLYWFVQNVFTIVQTIFVRYSARKKA